MRRDSVAFLLPLLVTTLAGCGEKPAPAKAPAVEKLPPPAAPAPPPIVQRPPSKEMAAHFPFKDEEITTLAYSDLSLLSQPDAVTTIATSLAPLASELAGVDKPCVDAIVGGSKELLVAGTTQQQWVVILKIPGHTLDTTCTPKAAEPDSIDGATKAWRFKESGKSCAVAADWLACGTPDLVKRSLAAQSEPSLPVGLDPAQLLVLDDHDAIKDMKASLSSYSDRLEARIELNYDSDEMPRVIHEAVAHAAENTTSFNEAFKTNDEQKKLVDLIANAAVASHRGPRANIRVDLVGKPADQAARVGTLMSLLGKLAIRDRNEARKSRATQFLKDVADKIAKNWDAKDPKLAFGDKKLVSLPPVPKEVPKGQTVTPVETDWKSWKDLPRVVAPTFYQYEIKATPDGQNCDLIARGDLNGDGKPSTFKLHIRVDKSSKQLMIEPKIDETDPDE